ncbi:unnamed protein product [Cylicocyclus nassatus]|uniref:Uncharacterized protein n=1 Tax=Cylicocyclus nassatus TaxID=53992 RepID=A0AA36H5L5_CYLNA|nr:unnamed protein product [Cylicocyclus nassatus]
MDNPAVLPSIGDYLKLVKDVHLAIQTIGTFGLERTVAVNLTLAAVRLVTLLFGTKKSGTQQMYMIQSERRFLGQSLLTFLSELIYLYGTFWIGFRYLHLGNANFNTNMNFITRPISIGFTPIYYIMFSKEIRRDVLAMIQCRTRMIHLLRYRGEQVA